ncbi:polysaccharide pyruvyl transferase family protein [Enterococcus massiliensis]|uniref:polysaccharide pyruvyl transferase family protein n=1 Tax=Enterococcus massiliensis TaxID=1640685 RepID=UPI00065DE3E9|nr:polysaccharide pyruvyl transferase family protein [Enterococcus massiliensis]
MSKRYRIIEKLKKRIPLGLKLELIKFTLRTKKINSIQIKLDDERPKMFVMLGTDYPNLGDHALTLAHREFLETHFPEYKIIEFSVDSTLDSIEFLKEKISKKDILTIKGGGNIGIEYFREELLRRKILNTFTSNPVILFPQTVYFPNSKIGNKEFKNTVDIFKQRNNIHIFLRDKKSYSVLKKNDVKNIYLVPDIVFSMKTTPGNLSTNNKKALLCLRDDREKSKDRLEVTWISNQLKERGYEVSITDTVVDFNVDKENREDVLISKLSSFSESSLVVTDRLHGMIFSYISKTPCLVLETYNHKVTGQYEWISESNAVNLLKDKKDFINSLKEIERIYQKDKFSYIAIDYKHRLLADVIENSIRSLS